MMIQQLSSKKQLIERETITCLSIHSQDEIKCLMAQGFKITSISEARHNGFAANSPNIIVAERILEEVT